MTKYFCESKREAELVYEKREYYNGDYIYIDDLQGYEYSDFAKQVPFYIYLLNDKKLNYQFHKLMINIKEERKSFLKSLYLDFIKYLLKFYFKKDIFNDETLNDSYEINIYYKEDDFTFPIYSIKNSEFEKMDPNSMYYLIDSYEILLDYLFSVYLYDCSLDITRHDNLMRHINIIEVKLSNDNNRYRFIDPYLSLTDTQAKKDIPIDDLIIELNFLDDYKFKKVVQYKDLNLHFTK